VTAGTGGPAGADAEGAVRAFLACGQRRDFTAAYGLLDERITRTGPDGSVVSGREAYLGYLKEVFLGARSYLCQVRRCLVSADGRTVVVELDETLVRTDGEEMTASEVMVFDLTEQVRIGSLTVYERSSTARPPGTGERRARHAGPG
jgi:limonene-1,2-epoxide hydrolase